MAGPRRLTVVPPPCEVEEPRVTVRLEGSAASLGALAELLAMVADEVGAGAPFGLVRTDEGVFQFAVSASSD